MTEEHESDFLVTVRAQVMTRDESTEGWLPLAGGGLANVSIRKRPKLPSTNNGHEYIIYGQRLSDQSVILSCVINRDLKYYKVMPTFHHWRAGKQRNGLTFQTAADARAFDKGILRAYSELIDGMTQTNCPTQTPALNKYDSVGEDDVFMSLDLPIETENVQKCHSSPDRSENEQQRFGTENGDSKDNNNRSKDKTKNLSKTTGDKQTVPVSMNSSTTNTITSTNSTITTTTTPTIAPSENYAYVTLTAIHDYNYPIVDQPVAGQIFNASQDSISEVKKRNAIEAAQALNERSSPTARVTATVAAATGEKDSSLNSLKAKQQMAGEQQQPQQQPKSLVRCRYCHEFYNDEWNRKGSCEYAPDYCRSTVECISGLGCARCMLYHFMSDSEGETPQHPCECTNEAGCTKRWLGLTFLSFLVPCLWCYPPLRLCHMIGVRCGVCGGKHKPPV